MSLSLPLSQIYGTIGHVVWLAALKIAMSLSMVSACAFARFEYILPLETLKKIPTQFYVSFFRENLSRIANVFSSAFLQFAMVHGHAESQVISQEITP
jgi:hypothetical protein